MLIKSDGNGILPILFLLVFLFHGIQADSTVAIPGANQFRVTPFDQIGSNTGKCFLGKNAGFHLAGVVATVALIETDVDYEAQSFFHRRKSLDDWFLPVAPLGALAPPGIGLWLYFHGSIKSNREQTAAGCAVLQAQGVTFLYITLLKAITGRPYPNVDEYPDMREGSRTFRWGFGKGGVFWGWPSGHTGAVMAAASSLAAFYPEKKWMKAGLWLSVAYTTVGVTAIHDGRMHWFSDAIAADLMAFAIGTTIGKEFRKQISDSQAKKEKNLWSLSLVPYEEKLLLVMGRGL